MFTVVVKQPQQAVVMPVEADVAVTDQSKQSLKENPPAEPGISSSLQALTLAALALPTLLDSTIAVAADDEMSFQYGYYQEGKRDLYGLPNQYKPIRVDSLNSSTDLKLADRINLSLNYIQDTWSGATPITTAQKGFMVESLSGASSHVNTGNSILVDKDFNPLEESYSDAGNLQYLNQAGDNQLVHMLTSASPETRKQVNAKLGYEWDEAAMNLGGGVSAEPDYNAYFINAGGRWDFNQKLTTLNAGLSFTNSDISAYKMPQASGYIDYSRQQGSNASSGSQIVGNRQDWSGSLGLTQVLNKHAVINSTGTFTRGSGYLSNPYKAATFIFKDPNQDHDLYPEGVYQAELISALENRPDLRNQFAWDTKYVQYLSGIDGALHLGYQFFIDDWDINSHTFDLAWEQPLLAGWSVTPKFRYYSQSAADFYEPIYFFNQKKPETPSHTIDFGKLPIQNYSSDQRLSGFGALSGGISISKTFAKGIQFNAGFEYYSHAGAYKMGGGGENAYADFDYYLVNAGLNVELSALSSRTLSGSEHHSHHIAHHAAGAPSGVMFEHTLDQAGDVMVGYRYMYGRQAGNMMQGDSNVSNSIVAQQACGNAGCSLRPGYMNMHMHMLDLMYAPTDWLTLMLMPQFVDMNMTLESLGGDDSEIHRHSTGGVGDLGMYALFKLFDMDGHHLHTAMGFSAPTGEADIKLNAGAHQHDESTDSADGGYIHYGMQTGSGTWDFKPSLTYNGQHEQWLWGGQINGTVRMESQNDTGYAFGDILQTSAWGGYQLTDWLSATIRGIYTVQGTVRHEFNGYHPTDANVDYPGNYGGRFWDVGFGVRAVVPSGDLAGNSFGFEWLQPVADDFNGYQLQREGALSANWSFAF
jgi:hypothetical protein